MIRHRQSIALRDRNCKYLLRCKYQQRGRKDSRLSQTQNRLPDTSNVQHKGVTLRDRHGQWLIGLRTVPPWLRYTPMAESDIVGRLRWHEPHNQTLELGLGTQIKPTCSEITCAPLGQSPRP